MTIPISLLMPVGFTDRRRHEIYLWTMSRWRGQFPEWQFCEGTSSPTNYNRSQARNDAYRQADGEILVITDADCITNKANVLEAIRLVTSGKAAWVIAHHTFYSLTKEFSDALLVLPPEIDDLGDFYVNSDWKMVDRSDAGVLVVPRDAYESIKGYDERFNGWGYEDNAFAIKLRKFWGPSQRTRGDVAHLWHPRGEDFEQPYIKDNEKLYEEIRAA